MSATAIDYDKILDVALLGVRRASVFMGLGLNAAADPGLRKYALTDITPIQLVAPNADDETLAEYKRAFAQWISGNGLREAIEAFAVFLETVFAASLRVSVAKGLLTPADASQIVSGFRKAPLSKQEEQLRDRFGIGPLYPAYVNTLQSARTCMTHRRGRVSARDCNDGRDLVVRWVGIDTLLIGASGATEVLDFPLNKPVPLSEDATLAARLTERERRFPSGAVIDVAPRDLAEICLYLTREAQQVIKSAVEFAESVGTKVIRRPGSTTTME